MFDHEKFEAYQLSIAYWESALRLIEKMPAGNSAIREQLKRASSSISLNLAEGSGRPKTDDRKRFYSFARGSAMECAAISDLVARIEPQLAEETVEAKKLLQSIVCILSKVLLK